MSKKLIKETVEQERNVRICDICKKEIGSYLDLKDELIQIHQYDLHKSCVVEKLGFKPE